MSEETTKTEREPGLYWVRDNISVGASEAEVARWTHDGGHWDFVGTEFTCSNEDVTVLAGPIELHDAEALAESRSTVQILRAQVQRLNSQLGARHALLDVVSGHPARKLEDEAVGGLLRWVLAQGAWREGTTREFEAMKDVLLAMAPAAGLDVAHLREVFAKLTVTHPGSR